jgi:hypothetical protein
MNQLLIFDFEEHTSKYLKASVHERINFKSRISHQCNFNMLLTFALTFDDHFDDDFYQRQFDLSMYPYYWHPYNKTLSGH